MDSVMISRLIGSAKGLVQGLFSDIKWYPLESIDGYGEPTYGDAIDLKGFIEQKKRKIVKGDGSEITAGSSVLILDPVDIKVSDKIELPDGETPDILYIEAPLDNAGHPYMVTIYFAENPVYS